VGEHVTTDIARTPCPIANAQVAAAAACRSEWQIVLCSDIPVNATKRLAACCSANRPLPAAAAAMVYAAALQQKGAAQEVSRPDLAVMEAGGPFSGAIDWRFGECLTAASADVPVFTQDEAGGTQVSGSYKGTMKRWCHASALLRSGPP
jgi:hypothetical protein